MNPLFALPGPVGFVVILLVVLLLFGSRLPSVMRSLGRSVNEFKRGIGETDDDDDEHLGEQRKVGKRED
ncbi:MAG TPA: twin-arginine translocase TatA/TatE family subunit [Pirellulales bacterium]|jgi:sec-independent protein translocase protein TatA|nr:twin-arginine translocase TatA/TatE family subunit [Pirellulales bacterium]